MQECRHKAATEPLLLHKNWAVAVLVCALWVSGLLLLVHWLVETRGTDVVKEYEWAVLAGTAGTAAVLFALWIVNRIRYETRKRDEWDASLLAHDHMATAAEAAAAAAATAAEPLPVAMLGQGSNGGISNGVNGWAENV